MRDCSIVTDFQITNTTKILRLSNLYPT